jgi:hypothetical protein
MKEPHAGRLIRPWFLGASTVLFILLIPLLIYSVWDYKEMRRLDAATAVIQKTDEPASAALRMDLAGAAADADRYYRAAAALSSGRATKLLPNDVVVALRTAERDDVWPPELIAALRSWVDSQNEAVQLGDRAAALPFVGFAPGSSYSYLVADLVNVLRALGYRSVTRALSGDAEGAAESLYAEIRMNRPLDRLFAAARMTADLRIVFAHVRPPAGLLARLASALAELDRDDTLKGELVKMRASFIGAERNGREDVLMRPWRAHVMNRTLASYAEMIRVSNQPWPDRMDAIVSAEYVSPFSSRDRARALMRSVVEAQAERLALVRAARLAVAVEQYAREHAEQLPTSLDAVVPKYLAAAPVDPFSGRPLLLRADDHSYTVYSVGPNRRDDGGRDLGQQFGGTTTSTGWPRASRGADIGIRIQPRP